MAFVVCLFATGAAFAQTPVTSGEWLYRGIQLYQTQQYTEAADAFQHAINLQPDNVNAHVYLGTALTAQFIPGAATAENTGFADRAAAEFRAALQLDPRNLEALRTLAMLTYNRAGTSTGADRVRLFDEAADWTRKVIEIDPQDKQAYYTIGVIAWAKFYPELMQTRSRLGMRPETPGPLPDFNARQDLQGRFGAVIDEGIANLKHALEIDPEYDDAMAYLNLLIRERADLRDTPEEYKSDVAIADEFVNKALAIKRGKGGPIATNTPGPPPPPRPGQLPEAIRRIRVAGNVQTANLLHRVEPQYPPLAAQAQVHGVVRFQALIGTDGTVKNLQLLSGHPLLVAAAMEAVKQWLYRPTLLNGDPVEVITQIEVLFK